LAERDLHTALGMYLLFSLSPYTEDQLMNCKSLDCYQNIANVGVWEVSDKKFGENRLFIQRKFHVQLYTCTTPFSQHSFHPDDQIPSKYVNPGFKPFSLLTLLVFRKNKSQSLLFILHHQLYNALSSFETHCHYLKGRLCPLNLSLQHLHLPQNTEIIPTLRLRSHTLEDCH